MYFAVPNNRPDRISNPLGNGAQNYLATLHIYRLNGEISLNQISDPPKLLQLNGENSSYQFSNPPKLFRPDGNLKGIIVSVGTLWKKIQ